MIKCKNNVHNLDEKRNENTKVIKVNVRVVECEMETRLSHITSGSYHSFERANHIQLSSENNEINTKKFKQKGDKMNALRRQEGVNVAKENFV